VLRPEAFLLPSSNSELFCLFHRGSNPSRPSGAVVYIHPFAEEMNKSRRMAALQSRALAAAGFAVLQIDLSGCGDSGGEFLDSTWSGWIGDIVVAARWLRDATQCVPWLWGLRAGCLVAGEAAARIDGVSGLLYWQPVHSGTHHLQQFLRLRIAGQLTAGRAGERVGATALRAELSRGVAVEVGGYRLSPAIAAGLDAAKLASIPADSRVVVLEVSATDPPELTPASRSLVDKWRAAGHDIVAQAVTGVPFWATQEITACAPLITVTQAAIGGSR